MRTVVGIYDTEEQARDVVEDLIDAGFRRENISIATRTEGEGVAIEEPEEEGAGEGALEGAGLGAVVGGLTGLLIGLSSIAVPGLGAVAAAGPLAGLISGAVTGAVAGGIIGALVELGVPEEEAEVYAEAVRRGATLVAVRVDDEDVGEAETILNRYNPVDLERREERWREEGWAGFEEEEGSWTLDEIEEEREIAMEEAYEYEEDDEDLFEGELVEDEEDEAWISYMPVFRQHYDTTYATTGRDWSYYRPAYRYGYVLATEHEGEEMEWEDLEPEARRDWEERDEPQSWDEAREAVRVAYVSCGR